MVIKKLEERANSSFHSTSCIWFRCVDDVYGIMESNYIKEFHQYLNTKCDSIKFTRAEEQKGSLAFLDVLVTRTPEGSLKTTEFRKPPLTGRFWPFSSHHPLQQKLRILQTFFSRAKNILNEGELKQDETRTINNTLIANGFSRFHRKWLLAQKANPKKRKSWLLLPPFRISLSL